MKAAKPPPAPSKPDGPFPTANEVYARIQWDPRLDPSRYVLGIDQHERGVTEVTFTAFVPNGDIPWHRVVYFRDERQTVWDRRERRHRLDDLAHTPPPMGDTPADGFFEALPVMRFDPASRAWTAAASPITSVTAPPSAITLVTWNVLSDNHDAHLIETPRRIPALIDRVCEADADVVALQEVTPTFLRALLDDARVRARYVLSDDHNARTLDPDGVLVLSRLPVRRFGVHRFSRFKRFVQAVIDLGETSLHVVALHLTSDRNPSAAAVRARQLDAVIHRGTARGDALTRPPTVLLGDFNLRDETPPPALTQGGFVDAWRRVRPDDPGLTFDPAENRLASILTTLHQPARFDRIFTRDGALALVPHAVERLGVSPIATSPGVLHASDHFGVRCTFHVVGQTPPEARVKPEVRVVTSAPTYHSALVVIPPTELWEPIQHIRRAHDRSYERWMPHVNLVYGFVPEGDFDDAARALESTLAETRAFEVTLDRFDRFEHPGSTVVWLRPETSDDAWRALHASIAPLFPKCDEQSTKSAKGFTPHLTVGRFKQDDRRANATVEGWQRDWKPLRFTVDAVHLIRRQGDDPFVVQRTVRFGREALTFAGRIESLVRDATCVTNDECARVVYVVGSHRMGVATPASDTDLLAVGPAEVSTGSLFGELSRALASRPDVREVRVVTDAKVPVLRVESAGGAFDLFHARMPDGEPVRAPEELSQKVIDRMDPASQRAINAAREGAFVADAITRTLDASRFRTLALDLRAWAKARGVYGNAFGYPGGITWTLLALWSVARHPSAASASPEALRAHFFEALDAHDWSEPVTVREDIPVPDETKHDRLRVMTPSAPSHNSARNLTRSTAGVLRDEVRRARKILARDPSAWREVIEPLAAGDGRTLTLTASVARRGDLKALTGWLEGRMVTVILSLERESRVTARPWPRWDIAADATHATLRIELRAEPAGDPAATVRAVLRDALDGWADRPEGAHVEAL